MERERIIQLLDKYVQVIIPQEVKETIADAVLALYAGNALPEEFSKVVPPHLLVDKELANGAVHRCVLFRTELVDDLYEMYFTDTYGGF